MSTAAQNPNNSSGGPQTPGEPDASPEGPSVDQGDGSQEANQNYDALLEEDYDGNGTNILNLGDPHETPLETYEALAEQYDPEDVDVITVTGDFATNPMLKGGDLDPEEFIDNYLEGIDGVDYLAEELSAYAATPDGNHTPSTEVHGLEEDEELIEEYLEDEKGYEDGFDQYVQDYAEHLNFIDGESQKIETREYGLFGGLIKNFLGEDIGNLWNDLFGPEKDELTIIGGGPHYNGDRSPEDSGLDLPSLEEIYDEEEDLEKAEEYLQDVTDEDEIDTETVKELSEEDLEGLEEGIREGEVDKELSPILQISEAVAQDEKRAEKYQPRKERYEELFEESSENVLVLNHFMPDTRGQSEIDHLGGQPQGSAALRDVIEDYSESRNISVVGGHVGDNRYAEDVIGADLYVVGEGNSLEIQMQDGSARDHSFHEPEEWGGEFSRMETAQQPDQEEMRERLKQDLTRQLEEKDLGTVKQEIDEQVEERVDQGQIPEREAERQKQLRKNLAEEAAEEMEPEEPEGPTPEADGSTAAAGA